MAGGYVFRRSSDGWEEEVFGRNHLWHFHPEITKMADTLLVKVTMPPKGFHDFHRHPAMNEILYILKGTAEQWVENEMQLLQEGDSVYIDPDVVHATFNAGDSDLEFLAILAPKAGWDAGTVDEYMNHPYCNYRQDVSKLK